MSAAYEQLRVSPISRRLATAFAGRTILPITVLAIAGWLESARLRLPTPSLIDDWFAITYSARAHHALLHASYSSAPVDLEGRYRPAYTAVWNYAQWHLLGSPSVATAAAWGFLRITLFLVAVLLLATWLADTSARGHPILWLAPITIAITPGIAVDLARHSPVEPMMIFGLVTGLALVGVGLRKLFTDTGLAKSSVATIATGYALYLFGVYSKETSVCLLAFAPFFLRWLGPTMRARILGSAKGRFLFASSLVLLIAPLASVAIRLAFTVSGGNVPQANVHLDLSRRILAAAVLPLVGAPGPLGTWLWLSVVAVAMAVVVTAIANREREASLLVGVLATGFLMTAFAVSRGDTPSRYYIPWIVAVAAVAMRGLLRVHKGFSLALAVTVVAIAITGTRDQLGSWIRSEQSGSSAVEMAKGVVNAGCPLYLANFDVERRVAIPLLLDFGHAKPVPTCTPGDRIAYTLSWRDAPLPRHFSARCNLKWQQVSVREGVSLYLCRFFNPGAAIPDQDAASGRPLTRVVRLHLQRHPPDPRLLFTGA